MMLELNTIHCVDFRELLAGLDDGSVNLILSDLPYGVTACEWDTPIDLTVWWQEVKRVLAPRGAVVMTATQPFTTDLIVSNRKWFRHDYVWIKDNGSDFLNVNRQPFKCHESVLVFAPAQPVYHPQMTVGKPYVATSGNVQPHNYLRDKTVGEFTTNNTGLRHPTTVLKVNLERGLHPTQKPLELFSLMVRTFTNEGDLVVDAFCGSGTSALAALVNGRNYIVGDTSAEYCEIAHRRVNPIFGKPPKRTKEVLPLNDLPIFRGLEE